MDGADVELRARQQRGVVEHAWKPGESGNSAGRPIGARNKPSEKFCADLLEHWQEHGVAAIDAALEKDPVDYVRVVASLMPKNIELKTNIGTVFVEILREMNKRVDRRTPAQRMNAGDDAKIFNHGADQTTH